MSTKAGTQQMCDILINSLSWIDDEPETELILSIKEYRSELIMLPVTVIEGQRVIYPDDPRHIGGCQV